MWETAPRRARKGRVWVQQSKKKKKSKEPIQPGADSAPRRPRGSKQRRNERPVTKSGGVKNLAGRGFRSHQEERGATSATKTKPVAVPEASTTTDTDSDDTEVPPNASTGPQAAGSPKTSVSRQMDAIQAKKSAAKRRRYILFVGNIPKTASHEDVVSHFEKKGVRVAEFRLLTHKDTGNSKGCGFLELGSDKMMRSALKFHRSLLKKKHLNVEVTCGGGGKSAERKAKIAEKNRALRRKRAMTNPFKHTSK